MIEPWKEPNRPGTCPLRMSPEHASHAMWRRQPMAASVSHVRLRMPRAFVYEVRAARAGRPRRWGKADRPVDGQVRTREACFHSPRSASGSGPADRSTLRGLWVGVAGKGQSAWDGHRRKMQLPVPRDRCRQHQLRMDSSRYQVCLSFWCLVFDVFAFDRNVRIFILAGLRVRIDSVCQVAASGFDRPARSWTSPRRGARSAMIGRWRRRR